jgi:hypothetical protein
MANQYVQVAPDSTGKKVQTYENVVGSDTVEAQAIVPVNSSGAPYTTANPIPTGVVLGTLAGATRVNSTAYEASRVLKASAGTLISLLGRNNSGSDQYIQLFDSTTVPSNGATPVYFFTAFAGSDFSMDLPVTGCPFTTGIAVCNSSTDTTKTLGSANCWFLAVVV